MYHFIAEDFKPDITIVLDIDPKIGLARSIKRQGNDEQRFENMDFSFHENIRKAFLTLAQNEPERFIVVNADQSVQAIHDEIVLKLKEKMNA